MNEDDLRRLLDRSAVPGMDDEVRAAAAVYAGHRAVTRRRSRTAALAAAGSVALAGGVLVALLPATSAPVTDVVLGCRAGTGTAGSGVVSGGADGVTLAVDNPTDEVLSVAGGGTSVLALPGTTSVTLPLSSGTSTVRCGSGEPVTLTVVRHAEACSSVGMALTSTVRSGSLSDLTRAELGGLPEGAVVDAPSGADPVSRVEVRRGGRVVAEAVWHAMPADASWQLESVSRCS